MTTTNASSTTELSARGGLSARPGLIWVPVLLVTLYYATPAFLHPTSPLAALIIVPAVVSCATVPLRHRAPWAATVLSLLMLLASSAALGGVVGVLASRARHLPGRSQLPGLVGCVVIAVVVKVVNLTAFSAFTDTAWDSAATAELSISVSLIGFAVLAGLLARASVRSASAERDAETARAAEIRLAERARIAREMHDVVAHRVSLVAMTSGALAYREDLPKDAHEAALIIQSNARTALAELRTVLSDLRGDPAASSGHMGSSPETPQPSLEQLPVLLAEVREATDVSLSCEIDIASLPSATSRHLYRIVQEGLTNARKHAPGAPVSIRLTRENNEIVLVMRNPLTDAVDDTAGTGGGYGLVGIQERAKLLGGSARVDIIDERFVLTVRTLEKVEP